MSSTTSDFSVRHGVTTVDVCAIEARLLTGLAKQPLPVLKTQQAVDLLYETIKELKAAGVSYEAISAGMRENGMVITSHSLGTMLRRHETRFRKNAEAAVAARRKAEQDAAAALASERLAARNVTRRANHARRRDAAKAGAAKAGAAKAVAVAVTPVPAAKVSRRRRPAPSAQ